MTFAAFMRAALYDPEDGFYARPRIGPEGDFVTSPHVSPLFGALIARQLGEAWDLLGRPDPFLVVEFAAGDGTLARQIVETAAGVPAFAAALRYAGVEATPGQRSALESAGVEVLDADALPSGLTGVVLANELLDNLPFRLARGREDGVDELLVGLDDGGSFVFVPVPAGEEVAGLAAGIEEGAIAAVGLEPQRWLARAAGILSRGWVLVLDYGGDGPRAPQTYRSHRTGDDLLRDPGSADITAGVDLAALAAFARVELGLRVWGPVLQRDALLALGFGELAERDRQLTAEARDAGRHLEALRRWSARSAESLLVDPAALGGLKVMAFGVHVDGPLAAVRADGPDTGPER